MPDSRNTHLHLDKPCDICGDAGFAESMSTCFHCQIAREHIYCMRILLKDVPEIWSCESCRSSNCIIYPKPIAKELLPFPEKVGSGALQTVGPSKLCKDPGQPVYLMEGLFPDALAPKSPGLVKSGTLQDAGPSKLCKDPGEKQMAVETAKVKFKPIGKPVKLLLASEKFVRSLQSNMSLIPCESDSIVIRTGPTNFSLVNVKKANFGFFPRHSKTPGHGNAEINSITQKE